MDRCNLDQLCSLCLDFQLEFPENIELMEKVEKYLQIKVKLKTGVCQKCFIEIQNFHEFYVRIQKAQENLNEYYSMQRSVAEKLSENFKEEVNSETKSLETALESQRNLMTRANILPDEEFQSSNEKEEENKNSSEENLAINSSKENEEKTSNTKSKLKTSQVKEVISDIEKKMIEFYNIKCDKCENCTFTTFKMLNKHYITVHNMQGYIKCCKRNIRVNDKYYLRSHMFKHLQPDSCRCQICGKVLSSLSTLKHHMILHRPNEERPFQCNKCDKRFCCKNDLRNHEKAIHVSENERENYICDVCGKVFQKIANLRYHYSCIHLQERKFICEICAKCFSTQCGLRTHLNAAHSSLDPIQCHECHKWLKTKDTFQRHLQLHQNKSYPCSHCDKVCNSSASLRSHLVKHSKERPYSCTVCRKSFKTKTHLKNHAGQHLNGSNYKCPYCSKLFVNMSNYYTHRKRMHSSEGKSHAGTTKTGRQEKELSQASDDATNNLDSIFKVDQTRPANSFNGSALKDNVCAPRQNVIVPALNEKYL